MHRTAFSEKSASGVSRAEQIGIADGFVLDFGEPSELGPLRARLQGAFLQSSYLPLRQIVAEVEPRRAILRGCVPTFYLKQLALAVAREILGMCSIENLVTVGSPTSPVTADEAVCPPTLMEVSHEIP